MLIPIRTDYELRRRPWVNYVLIAVNVLLYLAGLHGGTPQNQQQVWHLLLQPTNPQLYQFFSSMFLHGGIMHLAGNMLFLWVFGNAVNDRFGHVGYLAFYLAGGVLAGVGYLLLAGRAPVLGASGAISAVTGAYLVLFPKARVTLLVWFYFITTFQVSSLVFLAFQFVWNLIMSYAGFAGLGGGGVAYSAHSAGYVFGIGIAALLLGLRLLSRDSFDLLSMLRSWRRRTKYRRMVAQGYDPFRAARPGAQRDGRWVDARAPAPPPTPDSPAGRELQLRRDISAAVARHDLVDAADKYLQLVQIADDAVLARGQQLDVANQLMSTERYPAAADAYERFLRHYGNYEHVGDVYLMLGIVYARYLHQYDRAEQCLQQAAERLGDERKTRMARNEIQAVRRRRHGRS